MLVEATESLQAGSNPALTVTASVALVTANVNRNGLNISNLGATNPLFLLLGAGTASAANAHIVVPVGQSWDGMVGVTVWRGAVQGFSVTTPVGIAEV